MYSTCVLPYGITLKIPDQFDWFFQTVSPAPARLRICILAGVVSQHKHKVIGISYLFSDWICFCDCAYQSYYALTVTNDVVPGDVLRRILQILPGAPTEPPSHGTGAKIWSRDTSFDGHI